MFVLISFIATFVNISSILVILLENKTKIEISSADLLNVLLEKARVNQVFSSSVSLQGFLGGLRVN